MAGITKGGDEGRRRWHAARCSRLRRPRLPLSTIACSACLSAPPVQPAPAPPPSLPGRLCPRAPELTHRPDQPDLAPTGLPGLGYWCSRGQQLQVGGRESAEGRCQPAPALLHAALPMHSQYLCCLGTRISWACAEGDAGRRRAPPPRLPPPRFLRTACMRSCVPMRSLPIIFSPRRTTMHILLSAAVWLWAAAVSICVLSTLPTAVALWLALFHAPFVTWGRPARELVCRLQEAVGTNWRVPRP